MRFILDSFAILFYILPRCFRFDHIDFSTIPRAVTIYRYGNGRKLKIENLSVLKLRTTDRSTLNLAPAICWAAMRSVNSAGRF